MSYNRNHISRMQFSIVFTLIVGLIFLNEDSIAQTNTSSDIKQLLNKAEQFEYNNPDSAFIVYTQINQIAQKEKNDSLYTVGILGLGYCMELKGRPEMAEKYYFQALSLNQKINNSIGIAVSFNALGNICYYKSDLKDALSYYQKSLKLYEQMHAEFQQSQAMHNIALIHDELKDYNLAKMYYEKALVVFEKNKDTYWISTCHNNMGTLYVHMTQMKNAIEHFEIALALSDSIGDEIAVGMIYDNLGRCWSSEGKYDKAIAYLTKSLIIANDNDDYYSKASIYDAFAEVYFDKKMPELTIRNAEKSLENAKKSHYKNFILSSYQYLKEAYRQLGQYQIALLYADSAEKTKNELLNAEKTKSIQELEKKYQSQKNELQIENLEKEQKLTEIEFNHQRRLLFGAIALSLIIISIAFFLFKTLIDKKKANRLLVIQKDEIHQQNFSLSQLVEETISQKEEIMVQQEKLQHQNRQINLIHNDLNKSIQYAKRIQRSIMPSSEIIEHFISESFVILKPKDVVSGDFFWWTSHEQQTIITAADCTGHGVPGAFMSMLGISFLREIVIKEYITHPGVILRKLRKEIVNALQQKGITGEQKDGMDMSLININHQSMMLQYSGANNPIYIIKKNPLETIPEKVVRYIQEPENDLFFYELKPDKMPIAIFDNMSRFNTIEIPIEKGDLIYLFSDGFADQFGGAKGKKLKSKAFKGLLIQHAQLKLNQQKEALDNAFETWKDEYDQVDDVMLIGIKV